MFPKKTVLLPLLLISAPALADNPTFVAIADQGIYYSADNPCGYAVAKDSANQRLVITLQQNPVYWFPGNDRYVDLMGDVREANRCPRRGEEVVFFCSPTSAFCQEAGRILQLDDQGELLEAVMDPIAEPSYINRMHLYSQETEKTLACEKKAHADEAYSILASFAGSGLAGCLRTVSDADTGSTTRYYSAECIERGMMPIYVANIQDRHFVNEKIALLAEATKSCDYVDVIGGGLPPRMARFKCANERIGIALSALSKLSAQAEEKCPSAAQQ